MTAVVCRQTVFGVITSHPHPHTNTPPHHPIPPHTHTCTHIQTHAHTPQSTQSNVPDRVPVILPVTATVHPAVHHDCCDLRTDCPWSHSESQALALLHLKTSLYTLNDIPQLMLPWCNPPLFRKSCVNSKMTLSHFSLLHADRCRNKHKHAPEPCSCVVMS